MLFQASDVKESHFWDLIGDDLQPIELSYSREESWLKYFSHSNLLYTRATRAIVNHAPIEEYHLCFFPNKDFSCSCKNYIIESRYHILHNYRRFNNYWNLRRDIISYFVSFIEFNKNEFT